jgi:hypothetical protein
VSTDRAAGRLWRRNGRSLIRGNVHQCSPEKLCLVIAVWLVPAACWAQVPEVADEATPTFGVTVVAPFGFCGRIYELPERKYVERPSFDMAPRQNLPPSMTQAGAAPPAPVLVQSDTDCSAKLPKFQQLQPAGNIYTMKLNVKPRDFREGFPGVTGRFEWFAIDYNARFWIEKPGKYSFRLLSDDGSALYIDERRIIDNDCMHPASTVTGNARLDGGIHDIRVSYFQGPRFQVALALYVKPPGEEWRVFDMQEFKPPPNPANWKYPNSRNLDVPEDPCKATRPRRALISRP